MIIRGGTVSTPMAGHVVTDDTKVSRSPWSSNNTVDKLCPSFDESGYAVRCEPVEGYPLKVVSTLPESDTGYTEVSFKHGGKNIYDPEAYSVPIRTTNNQVTRDGDVFTCDFTVGNVYININNHASRVITPPGTYTISFVPVNATTFGLTVILYSLDRTQISFKQFSSSNVSYTFTVNDPFIVSIAGNTNAHKGPLSFKVQLEVGSVATDYEAYIAPDVHTVSIPQIPGGSYDWETGKLTDTNGDVSYFEPQTIAGKPGVNTFVSDAGEIQVSGKADPVRVIEKLTNAIIALGGNI